jgi:hypothetical protein
VSRVVLCQPRGGWSCSLVGAAADRLMASWPLCCTWQVWITMLGCPHKKIWEVFLHRSGQRQKWKIGVFLQPIRIIPQWALSETRIFTVGSFKLWTKFI